MKLVMKKNSELEERDPLNQRNQNYVEVLHNIGISTQFFFFLKDSLWFLFFAFQVGENEVVQSWNKDNINILLHHDMMMDINWLCSSFILCNLFLGDTFHLLSGFSELSDFILLLLYFS